jgi:hypothetical protein
LSNNLKLSVRITDKKMEVQMKRVTTISTLVALALLISACNFPFVDTKSAVADSVALTVAAIQVKNAEETQAAVPTLAPLPTQVPTESESSKDGDRCSYGDQDCYRCRPGDDGCNRCDSWDDNSCQSRCEAGDQYCYRYDNNAWQNNKGGGKMVVMAGTRDNACTQPS